jgi:hypothetical protein
MKEEKAKKRPSIDSKVQLRLWLKSGGRCQYRNCNENLYEDGLTLKSLNKSYIAHIYGYAPNSARYDALLSPKLEKDFTNLMLLCDGCHRKIDREEKDEHPASLLIEMKKEHEDRIDALTSMKENVRTNVILYNSKIGDFSPSMQMEDIRAILVKKNLYPAQNPITLSSGNTSITDDVVLYWEYESTSLEKNFQNEIAPHLKPGKLQHFSLFSFGTMPLLVKLGTLLGDKHNINTYQLHREPQTWEWSEAGEFSGFKLVEPDNKTGIPVLNISLSANIDSSRIQDLFPDDTVSIWTLTHDNPNVNFLKTEEILSKWRTAARDAFSRIKDIHGHDSQLHVFPAMPLSASVEFGRVWNQKVDLPMTIYDGRDTFTKTVLIKRS